MCVDPNDQYGDPTCDATNLADNLPTAPHTLKGGGWDKKHAQNSRLGHVIIKGATSLA